MNNRNSKFHLSGNKIAPANLYYINLQPILTSQNHSRNFFGRTNTDNINISNNNVRKSKKSNLSQILDIKKNFPMKKKISLNNKKKNLIISTMNRIHMNNCNKGGITNKYNYNNTVRNNKILTSQKNYSTKGFMVKKKINFSNISNKSFKTNQQKKKKIKNTIPFNINKININIINNNNININTIKTEGNLNLFNKDNQIIKKRIKNFTLDKLPHFDELLKENITKEKNIKLLQHKKINKKVNILLKNGKKINSSLSNRLNKIISNNDDISLVPKNLKLKIIQKKRNLINEKSLEHKKIIPINYFQDYKKKNSSSLNKIKKEFINYKNYIKIINRKENVRKQKINKNKINLLFKQKRPYSKEEKSKNILKLKEKKKNNNNFIKQKILKIVAKKKILPEQALIKKIASNIINIISKSEIRKRKVKSNDKSKDKSKDNESQKKDMENDDILLYKIDESECDISDVLNGTKIPKEEIDNFDDLYSVVRILNFGNPLKKDSIFCIDDNNINYIQYKKKFDNKWNNNIYSYYRDK